ncbi:MAG: FAD-dependent oxidoreductase [Mogibacterium sp.]|nr:FAD-dependent oxidoreductase [Mogibacterium sp.]
MKNRPDIRKMNIELSRRYYGWVHAKLNENNRSIVVSGKLDNWQDILDACGLCVHKEGGWHVVNHIEFTGAEIPPMHMPAETDDSLDGLKPDVLIIGGGICGSAIARELSRWQLDILLVEKEADLAVQASSRNDGQVHVGVDQKKPNIKLSYLLRGNSMYDKVCEELGVPFERCGQYVAFKEWWSWPLLQMMAFARRSIGVWDTRVIGRKKLYKALPNLNEGYRYGLTNRSAGVVCPYGLTIAYAENAVKNGARVSLNTAVIGMDVLKNGNGKPDERGFAQSKTITAVHTNRGTVYPRLVINAAGVWSDRIAAMGGDEFFSIHPRRGTEAVLDRKAGDLTDTIFSYRDIIAKGEKNTKGGGIIHTVDNNILIGPDAVETYERENYATNRASMDWLFNKQKKSSSKLSERNVITYFTGVRASDFEEDFIVEKGRETDNLLHCAAIQSPGLTSAPALAVDVSHMAVEMLGGAGENQSFDPRRKAIPKLSEMSEAERSELIRENPDYGVIVCRCEEISRGEIIDALSSPICVPTLDGVKRRVRPGMGRCQGGFCGPVVTKIISEFMGEEMSEVTKSGNHSNLTYGRIK